MEYERCNDKLVLESEDNNRKFFQYIDEVNKDFQSKGQTQADKMIKI